MSEEIIVVGSKIELIKKSLVTGQNDNSAKYFCKILDMDDTSIVASMPIVGGHIIPLEVDQEFDTYIYTKNGIYRTQCIITERGKEGNIYAIRLEIQTKPQRYQRRQYFRLPCSIEAEVTILSQAEVDIFFKTHQLPDTTYNPKQKATIVDISGGGLKFLTEIKFDKESYLYITFPMRVNGETMTMDVIGTIVTSTMNSGNQDYYNSGLQFQEVPAEVREEIVKYVFQQQRLRIQKERGK
jgi:c-di-GMP-binding flagellar brake protein YcgR